jgi:hypothetical protein
MAERSGRGDLVIGLSFGVILKSASVIHCAWISLRLREDGVTSFSFASGVWTVEKNFAVATRLGEYGTASARVLYDR